MAGAAWIAMTGIPSVASSGRRAGTPSAILVRSTTWGDGSHVTRGQRAGSRLGRRDDHAGSQPPTFDTFRTHTTTYRVKSVGSTGAASTRPTARMARALPLPPRTNDRSGARYVASIAMSSTANPDVRRRRRLRESDADRGLAGGRSATGSSRPTTPARLARAARRGPRPPRTEPRRPRFVTRVLLLRRSRNQGLPGSGRRSSVSSS